MEPVSSSTSLGPGDTLVAVDVGGTTTRVGAVTREGAGDMDRFSSSRLGGEPLDSLAAIIHAAVPHGKTLIGAVVGLPVSFDAACIVALSSPNLAGFEGVAVAKELTKKLGVPVVVDRDTVLLATGEWISGAGAGAASMLGVFIGTGIGGAMLVAGVPYRGASGGAVEVGHLPIRDHGRRCICGNIDCLEAYASGHALEAIARDAGVPVADVFTHPAAAEGVATYVGALAHGLAAAVNMLDPHVLLLGGGLHGRPGFPRDALAAAIRQHLRAPVPSTSVEIRHAILGSDAVLHAAPVLFARAQTGRRSAPLPVPC
ncbi:ROK family protein [Acuticoccus sp. MNP-M23]|uniref:ROK family protein n=1 Tax=Acuticoccus sp. MNP-M23 TaxID=3072793 RepID=UPI002814DC25|nr:ROK family protein [Acuticoccus sp. MNP-M23]WMS43572.1 ROK family protein [Acuticoccus sp. MNP-M23]